MTLKLKLILIFLLPYFTVLACDCRIAPGVNKAVYETESIFVGKVVSVTDDPESCYLGDCLGVYVQIEVQACLKGINSSNVTLYTMKQTASCGFPFEMGEGYLIYADSNGRELSVSLCSRTKDYAEAKAEIAQVKKIMRKK